MSNTKAMTVAQPQRALSVFSNESDFAAGQRMCKAMTTSDLVPVQYRGENGMGNALIALDMANRIGMPTIMVMQNLDVIEGRPSWKSQFIIGALNSCGLFSPIRFRMKDLGEQEVEKTEWSGPKGQRQKKTVKVKVHNRTCIAYAIEKGTGEVLEGPEVSIGMAVAEGWYFRPGSKWLTMPDLMLRYRAAAFFGRLYAPHILNGMPAADEAYDLADDYSAGPGEIVDAEPVKAEAEKKPAGRAKGVHAAMNAAKGSKARAEEEPAKEDKAGVIDAEAEPLDDEPINEPSGDAHEEGSEHAEQNGGAPFGDPDEDDGGYSPA